jgi:hypothetical protein
MEQTGPSVDPDIDDKMGNVYLDHCEIYGSFHAGDAPAHPNGSTYRWKAWDSPGFELHSELGHGYTQANVYFEARMEFMYKPGGSENIWVPLGSVDWAWAGQAEFVGPDTSSTGGWEIADSASGFQVNQLKLFPVYNATFGTGSCRTLPTN